MNTTLRNILIGIGVLVVGIAVYVAVLLTHKKTTPITTTSLTLPATYSVHVTETNAVYTAQLLTTNSPAVDLTNDTLNQYLIIGLNQTHDTLLMICPTGYTNTGTTADSGVSTVTHDPDLGSSLEIAPNTKEVVTVTCTKK